jgi:hypothetical protein
MAFPAPFPVPYFLKPLSKRTYNVALKKERMPCILSMFNRM